MILAHTHTTHLYVTLNGPCHQVPLHIVHLQTSYGRRVNRQTLNQCVLSDVEYADLSSLAGTEHSLLEPRVGQR